MYLHIVLQIVVFFLHFGFMFIYSFNVWMRMVLESKYQVHVYHC